ncbi:class A beta-lactamase-related serine hydrolase [Candidatus Parcubacteria bacterium]|nr:class A beta-lactamase-related serine hydrolase [Candidatus Parcubacteria bacterium]
MYMSRRVLFLVAFGIFLAGALAGWVGGVRFFDKYFLLEPAIRENAERYDFIHPLLSTGDLSQARSFSDLVQNVHADIERFKAEGKLISASVYFRDLEVGRWMGVDEEVEYAPASLYKVALMMTYLKGADLDPSLLERETLFKEEYRSAAQDSDSFPRLEAGKSYSIAELLRRMIVYSDNDSKNTLQAILDTESRQRIFADFGVTIPELANTGDSLSPKEYSLFFRVLYNASYLSRSLSEAALKVLSEAEFKEGLVAGVPEGVRVAHKFGSRVFPAEGNTKEIRELHDCGIIYYPDHPYFLCVMTKGVSAPDLAAVIRSISTRVYNYVSRGSE